MLDTNLLPLALPLYCAYRMVYISLHVAVPDVLYGRHKPTAITAVDLFHGVHIPTATLTATVLNPP